MLTRYKKLPKSKEVELSQGRDSFPYHLCTNVLYILYIIYIIYYILHIIYYILYIIYYILYNIYYILYIIYHILYIIIYCQLQISQFFLVQQMIGEILIGSIFGLLFVLLGVCHPERGLKLSHDFLGTFWRLGTFCGLSQDFLMSLLGLSRTFWGLFLGLSDDFLRTIWWLCKEFQKDFPRNFWVISKNFLMTFSGLSEKFMSTLLENCFKNWFWTMGSAQIGKCMTVKVHVF